MKNALPLRRLDGEVRGKLRLLRIAAQCCHPVPPRRRWEKAPPERLTSYPRIDLRCQFAATKYLAPELRLRSSLLKQTSIKAK
ncbi:hypothetical protein NDU88_002933 [Pleurodeles waltl]|uniref:Uncharacterized protein n=1 Tax=Pleurodeles waltl TaxID=8319 RepID=A0AAV7QDB4_PLEWA|nr:hypothetical protein NDU88_002933 [Pleurodeles waltl]